LAWDGYVLRRGVNLIVGAKGVGKTSFVCWLAARASVGDVQFGGAPLRVFIDSQEDDAAIVLRPRVEAAGGDMTRIVTREPGTEPWHFPRRLYEFKVRLAQRRQRGEPIDLVVFDSLSAYVPRSPSPNTRERRWRS
jgi:AAA domain